MRKCGWKIRFTKKKKKSYLDELNHTKYDLKKGQEHGDQVAQLSSSLDLKLIKIFDKMFLPFWWEI